MVASDVRGSLALLTIPFIFSQDNLLTTDEFLKRAKERGTNLSLDGLQRLHNHRMLVPLFRVSDTPVEGRRIEVAHDLWPNTRSRVLHAAAEGRLRDPADEGYSVAWPYQRPADEDPRQWWNGFVFSSWQLLDLKAAINDYEWTKHGRPLHLMHPHRLRARRLNLVLSALSTPYLPRVLGRLTWSPSIEEDGLRHYRAEVDVQLLLRHIDYDPADLRRQAERLLGQGHSDPLHKWLPLLRYASYSGWSKLSGEPLDYMWRRVAAEVLLRAHEDLAEAGMVEPLPDLTGALAWTPLYDRLAVTHPEAQTLERALHELGLSPHPRVILLVEGETEMEHVPGLLAEFGLIQPQQVRVIDTKSSSINAQLIARYGITPRVGRQAGDRWLLDASPTALVIAMDPENHFATQPQCDAVRRTLQDAIRAEVRRQGADIGHDELDFLVSIHTWGVDKYELANFTDDELVPAVTTLAIQQNNPRVSLPTWEQDLRAALAAARAAHDDIQMALGRGMHMREDKIGLAKLLWPTLRTKCEAEYVNNNVSTPVLKVVLEVVRLVDHLTGVFGLMGPAGDRDGN